MCRIEREGEGEGRDKEMRDFDEEMMVYVWDDKRNSVSIKKAPTKGFEPSTINLKG